MCVWYVYKSIVVNLQKVAEEEITKTDVVNDMEITLNKYKTSFSQSAGPVEYTDCTSAEG